MSPFVNLSVWFFLLIIIAVFMSERNSLDLKCTVNVYFSFAVSKHYGVRHAQNMNAIFIIRSHRSSSSSSVVSGWFELRVFSASFAMRLLHFADIAVQTLQYLNCRTES